MVTNGKRCRLAPTDLLGAFYDLQHPMGSNRYLNKMKKIDINILKTNKSKWSWYDRNFVEAKKKVLKPQYKSTFAHEKKDLNRVKQL
jgi:hypothetical protein